jgi:hypothetical protein
MRRAGMPLGPLGAVKDFVALIRCSVPGVEMPWEPLSTRSYGHPQLVHRLLIHGAGGLAGAATLVLAALFGVGVDLEAVADDFGEPGRGLR